MTRVDLHLLSTNPNTLTVLVVGSGIQLTLSIPMHARVLEAQAYWRRQFQAHHDRRRRNFASSRPFSSANAVAKASEQLGKEFATWLKQPPWLPLHEVLERHPSAAVRLQFDNSTRLLEPLPWEILFPMHSAWRGASTGAPNAIQSEQLVRRPRVLLLEGYADGLELDQETRQLEELSQQGRIELLHLRQGDSNHAHLCRALLRPGGWDVLAFLGHSEADPISGGCFYLGDGSNLPAESIQQELAQAARNGLHLVLLNSCEGVDLARSCVAAGVDWVFCFLDRIPDQAAAQVFHTLIRELESGCSLVEATERIRDQLAASDRSGLKFMPAIYSQPAARPFFLPMSRRSRFVRRLGQTQRPQRIAAALALSVAAVLPLDPTNPFASVLLDRRLELQRQWRSLRGVAGPIATPLPVLLLDDWAYPAPGGQGGGNSSQVSRAALATLLERTPVSVRKVGFDFALDAEEVGTARLASVIRQQQRALVVAGFFGGSCPAVIAGGRNSGLHPLLLQSGAQQRDLSSQIIASNNCAPPTMNARRTPLQLGPALTAEQFAGSLAEQSDPVLPAHSVIDWSIDWFGVLGKPPLVEKVASINDLPRLTGSILLVGRGALRFSPRGDVFTTPLVVQSDVGSTWGGSSADLPGAVLQAVLIQSINLNHWLTPIPYLADIGLVALCAGLGVGISAATPNRRTRWLLLGGVTTVAVPLAMEMVLAARLLIPITLPMISLAVTTLLRREDENT